MNRVASIFHLPACIEHKTDIVIGGPYNSGILVGGETYDYAKAPREIIDKVVAMKAIAQAHQIDLPAAALQFAMAHPAVVSVIPGMRSPKELFDNLQWAEQQIPDGFWSDLKNNGLLRTDAPVPGTALV